MRFLTALTVLVAVLLGADAAWAQVAADSTGPVVGGIIPATGVGALLYGLWQIWGPVLTTKLFAQWNVAQGRLDGLNDQLKAAAYFVLTWAALYIPKAIGYSLDHDPHNWTIAMFFDVLTALAGVLFAKINITMTKEKRATVSSGNISA